MVADHIVATGRANCLKDPETRKQIDAALREIRARYVLQMRTKSLATRCRLWLAMRRELRAAVERIAPSRGCYLRE